ncbi:MAG: hypothetical protein QOJ87_2557, partial [Verrucomicrobiota bacterium]
MVYPDGTRPQEACGPLPGEPGET